MNDENFDEALANSAIDYFDDLPEVEQPPATLELLTELAVLSRDMDQQITIQTVALEELTAKRDKLLRQRIPEIMESLGMEKFTLKDGSTVSVKNEVKCSISAENKFFAFKWLEDNNFDGIIKTKVASEFGKGEIESAKEALKALEAAGFSASLDQNVHPATLKSFVKECLENGTNIPVDTFGVFEFKQAAVKLPKAKK